MVHKLLDRLEPETMQHFHGWSVDVWVLLIIPTVVWWSESILWVAFMSIWAAIMTHATAYHAARAEKEAQS